MFLPRMRIETAIPVSTSQQHRVLVRHICPHWVTWSVIMLASGLLSPTRNSQLSGLFPALSLPAGSCFAGNQEARHQANIHFHRQAPKFGCFPKRIADARLPGGAGKATTLSAVGRTFSQGSSNQ